jgi:predicted anti-sigma-YlaC factor YlaD
LSARRIGVVVIDTTSWPRIKKGVAGVIDAVNRTMPGGYVEVAVS